MYRSFGRSFLELLLSARRSPAELLEEVELRGWAHFEAAQEQGRGVLFLSAHLGNWELLLRLGAAFGPPLWVISRRFKIDRLQRLWLRLREGGTRVLNAKGSGRAALRALKRGELLAFVLDQHDPSPRALAISFLGRPAATSPDLARLAQLSGAPILPIFISRQPGGRQRVEIQAAISSEGSLEEITARCSASLEAAIRANPEQWLWIHRRWKLSSLSAH